MLNDDHRDRPKRRRWLPPVMLVAGLMLALLSANYDVRAAGTTTSTPDGVPSPGFEPFPATTEITDTIIAALSAYDRAVSEAQPVAVDPAIDRQAHLSACRPLSPRVFLPLTRGTGTPATIVKRADMAVTIWPTPSIYVMRNGTLSYELRIRNDGQAGATRGEVTLPYGKQQLRVIGSQFTNAGDWVSELTDDHITVTLAPVAADSARTAAIRFLVNNDLPNNTVITMRAAYRWQDDRGGGNWRSNWAPLLVGNGNESAPWTWLEVQPLSGIAGTTFHFYTDRFIPREGVIVWLNMPSGTQATIFRPTADSDGRACVDFRSSGLQPGSYSLVLYGARSRLTAIVRFYVL